MSVKEKWFVGIALFYIAYMVFPLVVAFTPIPLWLLCIGVSVVLLVMYPNCLRQRFLYWFLAYFLVLFIYCLIEHPFHINGMGDSNAAFRRLTIEMAWIFPNLLISSIVIKLNNNSVYKILGKGIMILLILSLIVILPTILQYSSILRDNLRAIESGDEALDIDLPGYTLMSCYAYFVPVLCYGFKKAKKTMKIVFAASIALFVFAVIKTEITTSFIAVVIVIIFTLVYQNESRGNTKTIIAFFVILIVLWLLYVTGVVLQFVELLIRMYEGTVAQIKFIEFREMLMGNDERNNMGLRAYLRQLSLQCFYNNPIIGSPGVGGHSSLLDRLGSMGLLGFLPFLFMLVANVKAWIKQMPERGEKFFYISGIVIVFMFLYVKGLFGGEGMLFMTVLLPVGIIGIYRSSTKKTIYIYRKSKKKSATK